MKWALDCCHFNFQLLYDLSAKLGSIPDLGFISFIDRIQVSLASSQTNVLIAVKIHCKIAKIENRQKQNGIWLLQQYLVHDFLLDQNPNCSNITIKHQVDINYNIISWKQGKAIKKSQIWLPRSIIWLANYDTFGYVAT